MRDFFCKKCNKKTEHLELVHNSGGFQYQYLNCTKCTNRILSNKIKTPPWFEEAVRTHSIKPIERFTKKEFKK